MAAVAAEVGERAQLAVVAADEQHAALADRLGPHVTRRPAVWELRPTHIQSAPKKYFFSQANTSGST